MNWSGLSLVTDAEIGELEPQATHRTAPWGATSWPAARSAAKRDVAILLEVAYPDLRAVCDRIRDTWPADAVYAYTGGAYADRTTEATDDTEADLSLAGVFATHGTDRLYVGAAWEFDGLSVQLSDRSAVTSALTVQYWGPTGWTTITATDGTAVSGATCGQSGRILWTPPADWDRREINGSDRLYWIALSVSATPTSATATQVVPVRAAVGLKRVAAYLALGHIYRGLAAQSGNPAEWRAQADWYRSAGEKLFAELRDRHGIPVDLNRDEVVTQAEQVTAASIGRVSLGRA